MTYSMASTVEASSLSSITALASSPPSHPSAPTQSVTLPLILYVARVPGSRDVFLTPIKPRAKVVSAEDVQSSLYYVHINCEDDHQLLAEAHRESSVATSDAPPLSPNKVKRKPVLSARRPVAASYPVDDPLPDAAITKPLSPRKPQQIARKPVLADVSNAQTVPYTDTGLPIIPSRPLPIPPNETHGRTSVHAEGVRLLRHSGHGDENSLHHRSYTSTSDCTNYLAIHELGSLTLIRRDPASSRQWNVASIHDPPVHEVSSSALLNPSAAKRTKKNGAPVYLDINNPGYSQFIDKDRPDSRISTSTYSSLDSEPPAEGVFRRRLYMPGSRYGDHGYGHHRIKSVDSAGSGDMRRSMRDHTPSDCTGENASVDRRSKGYSFTSPWDGKCEFSTGATGKSLKCRHTTSQQRTVEVSELRFNLPTSSARESRTPTSEKRSSYFSHRRLKSHDSGDDFETPSIVLDDDGRVDLTLGQERAGGGLGGKQAKLGKLIIAPEGLKMLDLLVAANIGLWWRAYERM